MVLGVCLTPLIFSVSSQQMQPPPIQVAEPGAEGRRITDDGLLGNYFPGTANKGPAVLLLGGSDDSVNREPC
jgi:hypothetical protein